MSSPYTTPAYSVRTSGTAERITRDANRSLISHHRPSTRAALARSYQAETRAARRQEVREPAVTSSSAPRRAPPFSARFLRALAARESARRFAWGESRAASDVVARE